MRALQPVVLGLVVMALAGCGTVAAPAGSGARPGWQSPALQGAASIGPHGAASPPPAVLSAVADAQSFGPIEGSVQWTTSTTQRAAALDGTGPGTADAPIYLVQLRGRFELSTAPRPPGANSPRGSVLLLFVPVGGSQTYGGGVVLSYKTVDLGVFGPVNTFLPPRRAAKPARAV